MASVSQMALLMVSSAAAKVLTFQTSANNATGLTTYTFSAQAIGTAAADRRVIVTVAGTGSNNTTITTVTVGGVTATEIIDAANSQNNMGVFIALVTTDTTADIVITFSNAKARCAIGVWSCTGLSSDTAVDSDSSTAEPGVITLTTVASGFAVSMAADGSTGSLTHTWTNLTEQFDATVSTRSYSGASDATAGTSLEITADRSGAGTQTVMVAASW